MPFCASCAHVCLMQVALIIIYVHMCRFQCMCISVVWLYRHENIAWMSASWEHLPMCRVHAYMQFYSIISAFMPHTSITLPKILYHCLHACVQVHAPCEYRHVSLKLLSYFIWAWVILHRLYFSVHIDYNYDDSYIWVCPGIQHVITHNYTVHVYNLYNN